MRNTIHVKKYKEPFTDPEETSSLTDADGPVETEVEQEKPSSQVVPRQTQVRKLPERFKDFVMI